MTTATRQSLSTEMLLSPEVCDEIRNRTQQAMLAMAEMPLLNPSSFWAYCISHMDYVRELPAKELNQIRRHTFHITGDSYQYYLFTPPHIIEKRLLETFDHRNFAPHNLEVNEPTQGIGLDVEGRFLSIDSQRYQLALWEMNEAGLFDLPPKQNRVLEIGGGYGGLAKAFVTAKPHTQYCILDLPQTMFFAAIFLSRFMGPENVTLALTEADLNAQTPFLLIPIHLAPSVKSMQFDCVMNQSSLQEMSAPQIEYYMDLINQTSPRFYSRNKKHTAHLLAHTSSTDPNAQIEARMKQTLWQSHEPAAPPVHPKKSIWTKWRSAPTPQPQPLSPTQRKGEPASVYQTFLS